MRSTPYLEDTFYSCPDGIIIADQDGKISRINAAALQLFQAPLEQRVIGMDYQQFFQRYDIYNELRQPISPESWLNNLAGDEAKYKSEQTIILRIPSQKLLYVNIESACIVDARQEITGMVSIFHIIPERYQQAFHLQQIYKTVLHLKDAIAHLPDYTHRCLPETKFFLTPTTLSITEPLIDVLREVVNCNRICILGVKSPEHYVHYVAGSGWTPEQEQIQRDMGGRTLATEMIDEATFARLQDDQQVTISSADLLHPLPFSSGSEHENILVQPLLLRQQLIGVVCLDKTNEGPFTADEMELVRVITAEMMLLLECINSLHRQTTTQEQSIVMQEVNYITNDFLSMASHELFTPLTGIMGNLQLAQRRLKKLKHLIPEEGHHIHAHIEHIEQSLAAANESSLQQQRIINNLIDDMRIKTNSLCLSKKIWDLRALLKDTVVKQRKHSSEYTIIQENESEKQPALVNADAGRIAQVITTYLETALKLTVAERPIRVGISIQQNVACVFVMEDVLAISPEEQQYLWERFSDAKKSPVCSELDLNLGLSFYLCQELIKRHGGTVGMKSEPGYGAEFWFVLPLALPAWG